MTLSMYTAVADDRNKGWRRLKIRTVKVADVLLIKKEDERRSSSLIKPDITAWLFPLKQALTVHVDELPILDLRYARNRCESYRKFVQIAIFLSLFALERLTSV